MLKICRPCLLALVICATLHPASGQEVITGIATNVTAPPASAYTRADTGSLTFENATDQLTAFTTASGSYVVSGAADYAQVQRNGTPIQSSVWYADGTGSDLKGVHQDTYGAMLKSNNFYEGSDNTFANGTGASVGNIERLDFTYARAFSNLSTLAFAVFDRGAVGVHDAFTIALVTGVDANGKPTAYGAALQIPGNWGGSTNVVANQPYNLFRYTDTAGSPDATSAANATNENGTQGIGGLAIKVSSFGTLPAGTKVYGYSLMGYDVNISNLNNLLDVTNTSVYPANTDGSTGGGGIDLAAVNGLAFTQVPEPGIGNCLAAGAMLFAIFRRRAAPR